MNSATAPVADSAAIWTVIVAMAIGSYALRFLFIGLVGGRVLPEWVLRHLRYTAVAFFPALVAPLVGWPDATGGIPDVTRLAAAGLTFAIGVYTKNVLLAMAAGFLSFQALTLFL